MLDNNMLIFSTKIKLTNYTKYNNIAVLINGYFENNFFFRN